MTLQYDDPDLFGEDLQLHEHCITDETRIKFTCTCDNAGDVRRVWVVQLRKTRFATNSGQFTQHRLSGETPHTLPRKS